VVIENDGSHTTYKEQDMLHVIDEGSDTEFEGSSADEARMDLMDLEEGKKEQYEGDFIEMDSDYDDMVNDAAYDTEQSVLSEQDSIHDSLLDSDIEDE